MHEFMIPFTIVVREGRYHVLRNGWPFGVPHGYTHEWQARKAIAQARRGAAA